MKKQNEFPPGWDEKRVQSVIAHYEQQTEDEAVAEDEAALADESSMLIEVPNVLYSGAKARSRLTTFTISSATMSTSSAVL